MRFMFGIPETLVCASLATLGGYMLNEGAIDKSPNAAALLIGGAAFLALGIVTLAVAVRSILWLRAMLRNRC